MNVLITGGMGVIGSMAAHRFVEEGHRPVLMARHVDKGLIRLIENDVDIEVGDVVDLPRILSIIQTHQITHIVHTAALIGELSHQNPPQSVNINVIGTLNILEAARFMKVQRVVYTSAKGVYGNITGEYGYPTYKPLTEDYPKNPVRIYESAKLMSEHMGQFYQRTYGLEFVALRFSQTYGPGKTVAKWGGRAVVSQIIEGACSGTPVKVEKGGDQKNDFLYTKDAALGIYLACTKREIHYSAYNIGTGVGVTLKDFAGEVKRLIPQADIHIGPGLSVMDEPRASVFDISRAQQDLGFSPRFPTAKAVEDYVTTLKRLGSG
jgi:UDP-glucose 4-epimerase